MTPLELRASLRRIRKCSERRRLLWQLLYPRPWRFQAKPLPPAHDVLTAKAKVAGPITSASRVQRNILQLHFVPLFRVRDTPLCSLYRLYEDLCSGSVILMGYESTYLFHHDEASWRLSNVADPKDADVVRYAVLASFVEALVAAFNWKIEQGLRRNGTHASEVGDNDDYQFFLETPPSWTSRVKPLAETLDLRPPNSKDGLSTSSPTSTGSAMTTRNLLSGPITFSAAIGRSTNVLQSLQYPERKRAFYSYIQERVELLAELIAHHLGAKPSEIVVSPQNWWRHGSFNLCIPILVKADSKKTSLPQFVMIRFPLPYRVGEAAHPGNSDEKLRCEAATYAWIDENCPDVPIPKLFGFGLGTNERFTKLDFVPWWSRWCHTARRFILSTAGYEQPSQYVCHNSSRFDALGIGYLLIESIAVDKGDMLSTFWAKNRDDARLHNLQRDIARIMVSLAQHPLPRIGTFSMDGGGYLRLDNRPISVESTIHENEGLTPMVSRSTTFSSVKDFIFSQISTFETRFLEQPNAIVDRGDALYQMAGLTAARVALPQLLRDDLQNGPFVFSLRDLHRSNIFVDQDWNVTAIIDLEFASSWPAEFIQTPYWLEYEFINDVTPTGFEARHIEFMEHIRRAEQLPKRESSGTESLSSIMQRSWDEGTFWVPLVLRDPVSFAELFYHRILNGCFGLTAEEIKNEQNYVFCSRIFRRNCQSIIDKKLNDQRTYVDRLEKAFADPNSDLA